jgi:hypothetical protein
LRRSLGIRTALRYVPAMKVKTNIKAGESRAAIQKQLEEAQEAQS